MLVLQVIAECRKLRGCLELQPAVVGPLLLTAEFGLSPLVVHVGFVVDEVSRSFTSRITTNKILRIHAVGGINAETG
jgi:hypothetical protein